MNETPPSKLSPQILRCAASKTAAVMISAAIALGLALSLICLVPYGSAAVAVPVAVLFLWLLITHMEQDDPKITRNQRQVAFGNDFGALFCRLVIVQYPFTTAVAYNFLSSTPYNKSRFPDVVASNNIGAIILGVLLSLLFLATFSILTELRKILFPPILDYVAQTPKRFALVIGISAPAVFAFCNQPFFSVVTSVLIAVFVSTNLKARNCLFSLANECFETMTRFQFMFILISAPVWTEELLFFNGEYFSEINKSVSLNNLISLVVGYILPIVFVYAFKLLYNATTLVNAHFIPKCALELVADVPADSPNGDAVESD